MNTYEIRSLPTTEVELRLRNAQEELFNLRFQFTIGQLQNHTRLRALRRDVARFRTILRERELAAKTA